MILGITGTLGAGKGLIVDYLVREKGFRHYSAREFIVREIRGRGLPVNRDTMVGVGNALRAEHSPGYIIESLYRESKSGGGDAIIESVRTEGEVEALRVDPEFRLLAVDADVKIRYERIAARKSETDAVSFEEFLRDETREMRSADPTRQNLARCIELADHRILNEGTIPEVQAQVDEMLRGMGR